MVQLIFKEPITPIRVQDGGYNVVIGLENGLSSSAKFVLQIHFSGKSQYFYVIFPQPVKRIGNIHYYKLLSRSNVAQFLDAISNLPKIWGRKAFLSVHVWNAGQWVANSQACEFTTPVEPVKSCDIDLASDPTLLYLGKRVGKKQIFEGRVLFKGHKGPSTGKFLYFVNASILETNPAKRGFDCVTFAKTVMGIPSDLNISKIKSAGLRAEDVITYLGYKASATKVPLQQLRSHFAARQLEARSVILLYKSEKDDAHHIAVEDGGVIYEFNYKGTKGLKGPKDTNGAHMTPLAEWRTGTDASERYTVFRKIIGETRPARNVSGIV